jgi:DNA helicase-2/ATP-dependent DNA helicase PcrA
MFYVALSRAENLLVLPWYTKTAATTPEFRELLDSTAFTEIGSFDTGDLPPANEKGNELGKSYSYTSDYLLYERCARQYMWLRKYEFAGSRSQTMLFGSLVHQTIEDLHHLLIEERTKDRLL